MAPSTVQLEVRLRTRGNADRVVGERNGRLLVEVRAPPVDGRANDALCRLLAKRAGVPRRNVSIVSGARSRDKRVAIET